MHDDRFRDARHEIGDAAQLGAHRRNDALGDIPERFLIELLGVGGASSRPCNKYRFASATLANPKGARAEVRVDKRESLFVRRRQRGAKCRDRRAAEPALAVGKSSNGIMGGFRVRYFAISVEPKYRHSKHLSRLEHYERLECAVASPPAKRPASKPCERQRRFAALDAPARRCKSVVYASVLGRSHCDNGEAEDVTREIEVFGQDGSLGDYV